MKRRIIISLLLGIIICCIAVYSFATGAIISNNNLVYNRLTEMVESKEKDILEKVKTNLNVQEEINTEEKIIGKGEKIYKISSDDKSTVDLLKANEKVTIQYKANGWVYIKSENIEGWVREESIKNENQQNEKAYINNYSSYLRKQPTASGEKISGLTYNNEVEILEKTNSWTKVKVNNIIGYVETKSLSDKKMAVATRSATYRTQRRDVKTGDIKNATGAEVAEFAKQFVGYRYVMGGASPSGFDCSGFTQYVYKCYGYSVSRIPRDQANDGQAVNKADLQPGDIICFSNSRGSSSIGHVGLYIGGGKFVHAANSRRGVIISNVDGDGFYYVCASRIIY